MSESIKTQTALNFEDALRIARGCMDYLGGYRTEEELYIFHHGVQTVINSLTAASKTGLEDTQTRALHELGAAK
jgi:transposase